MAKINSNANIPSIRLAESAAPDTPASGFFQVYAKTDGKLYCKNDAGTEVCLSDSLANPMTTAGDIIIGGVDGAPARLAAGTEDYVLTMGATNPEWAAGGGGGYTEGAKVYNNANQSLISNDVLTVAFNSEFYDTDNCHDNTTNNARLTCKTAGKYLIGANGVFSAALPTNSSIWIEHNSKGRIVQILYTGAIENFSLSSIVDMSVNDYIVLKIYCNTGTPTLNYSSGNEYSPAFWMQRIG